jgi:hypothetical protein
MGTTLVIVELLIVGFQVLIWVALLLWHFKAMPAWPEELNQSDALLFAFAAGTAYMLGIVCDRVLGHLSTLSQIFLRWFWTLTKRLWARVERLSIKRFDDGHRSERHSATSEAATPSVDEKSLIQDFYRNQIYRPQAYEALENASRQIRLLRATGVNGIIIAVILFAWYPSHYKPLWILLASLGFASFLA